MLKLCISFLIFLVLLSCQSNNLNEPVNEVEWPNHPPIIKAIEFFPGTRGIAYSFDLVCAAEDADGDSLSYEWKCMEGHFISSDGYRAFWVADSLGLYSVGCSVSDGQVEDTEMIIIPVIDD